MLFRWAGNDVKEVISKLACLSNIWVFSPNYSINHLFRDVRLVGLEI